MENTKPKNSSAFPNEIENGLTMRDYFAAKAMQGFISTGGVALFRPEDIAVDCELFYAYADAMLSERERENTKP